MAQQTIDWTRLTGKTLTTTKGAPFKVTRVTAKSITIRPASSTRSYDLSVPDELDRCVAEYATGRFFPSAMDLVRIGVRHERNSYVWGVLKAVLIDRVLENAPPASVAKKPVAAKSFAGVWRIIGMPNFDADFLTEGDESPHITLRASKFGDIDGDYAFSYSSGAISGAPREFGGETLLIFGFEGNDDMDAVTGAGWAKLVEPNEMAGEFLNDYGTFTATRTVTATRSKIAGKLTKKSAPVADDEEEDEFEDEEDDESEDEEGDEE